MHTRGIWYKQPDCGQTGGPKAERTTSLSPITELPRTPLEIVQVLNMVDLTEIKLNDYYRPLISNFAAVDAIAQMNRRVFDPSGADEQVEIGFQSTVSKKKHKGVARDELDRIRAHLRALTENPARPFLLVFVTVVEGINSLQRLGKTTEAGGDAFEQFVIRRISFEATKGIQDIPEVMDESEADD